MNLFPISHMLLMLMYAPVPFISVGICCSLTVHENLSTNRFYFCFIYSLCKFDFAGFFPFDCLLGYTFFYFVVLILQKKKLEEERSDLDSMIEAEQEEVMMMMINI